MVQLKDHQVVTAEAKQEVRVEVIVCEGVY